MKILLTWLFVISISFANDATIDVIKKVESLPTIAIEDSSISYDETFKLRFFKAIVADLNVISIFNVDRHYIKAEYNRFPTQYASGANKFSFDTKLYGDSRIKMKLIIDQHSKCAFCESTIPSTSHGTVEHFRPKGGWVQNDKDGLKYPGYYWLAYSCENLFFVCQKCNETFKKNYFPVRRPDFRPQNHNQSNNIIKEKPFLVNPLIEDPRNLIRFDGAVAKGIDKNQRGKKTIKILGLNRKGSKGISMLYEERKQYLDLVEKTHFISTLSATAQVPQTKIDEAMEKMRKLSSPNGKFSSMIKDNF